MSIQFSTLVINIQEITNNSILYTSKTDIKEKVYKYLIPNTSNFPYDDLEEFEYYALISAKVDGVWHWVITFSLQEKNSLCDEDLVEEIL
jgi:hypothetical protein